MIHRGSARTREIVALLVLAALTCLAQTAGSAPKHTPAGKPDLNGVWQAMNTANWDLLAHGSAAGAVSSLGAIGAVPPGEGVVEGGIIPYLPAAAAKKQENFAHRWTDDPEIKCFMPGVPRANYMPYPFQIVQGEKTILFTYSFASAVRTIRMGIKEQSPVDSWMGWSVGRWEGSTLVVDVSGFNDQTWFDRAGDFHSDKLHVVERYTPRGKDAIDYEATMEDPEVFSRPWKISMPLYRHLEKNAHVLEFQCIEYSEEVLYGPLRHKKGGTK